MIYLWKFYFQTRFRVLTWSQWNYMYMYYTAFVYLSIHPSTHLSNYILLSAILGSGLKTLIVIMTNVMFQFVTSYASWVMRNLRTWLDYAKWRLFKIFHLLTVSDFLILLLYHWIRIFQLSSALDASNVDLRGHLLRCFWSVI